MSGPVLDFDPGAVRRPLAQEPDTRDAPSITETISAAFTAQRADTTGAIEAYQVDAYRPIIDALIELQPGAQFTRYVNPSSGTVSPQSVWRDVQRFRGKGRFTELPATVEEFEKQWREAKRKEIQEAEGVAARGNGVAAFFGGTAGALTDPVNVYTLPVGGWGKGIAAKVLTEGGANMGIEFLMLPTIQRNREELGRPDLTAEEAGLNIAFAGVGAAALRGGVELAPGAARLANDKLVQPLRRALDPDAADKDIAKAFEQMVPANLRTPEQEAALFVIKRAEQIRSANPYVDTLDALDVHVGKMQTAMDAIEEGRIPGEVEITTAGPSAVDLAPVRAPVAPGAIDFEGVKAAIAGPESGGRDNITNAMGSSAAGRYQFIRETFIRTYRRAYGVNEAAAARAWETSRFDRNVQERLMDRLLTDNANALSRAGIATDSGNLYLAHFAGAPKAIELLRADPNAPVAAFFSKKAIAQNPGYLGGGKTVAEAIEVIRGKVGDPGQRSPVPVSPEADAPPLRDLSLDAERPVSVLVPDSRIDSGLAPEIEALVPGLIDVVNTPGRSLNQLGTLAAELGTDEATLKLAMQALVEKGAITQNSKTGNFMRKVAAPQTIANQKRPRTLLEFLAERGGLNDYGGERQALGLRRSDRRMGAKVIRNVRAEDGTVKAGDGSYGLDTAFQDAVEAGYFPEFEGVLTDTYGDLLDGPALLVNAISQELSGAPRYRMDDWPRLKEFKLQGATENDFGGWRTGDDDMADAEGEGGPSFLDKFKADWDSYGYDAADFPEGPLLDRAAGLWADGFGLEPLHAVAQAAKDEYEELLALAIKAELAQEYAYYDPWNPQWDAEFDRRFAAAQARGRADGADGQGQPDAAGNPAKGNGAGQDAGRAGSDVDPAGLSPRAIDEAAAARPRSDHTDLPPDPDPRFAEPDGPGIVAAAESAWHDIRQATETDPAIAERQRTEAQLRADAPLRGENATGHAQDGEMGLGLFDAVDQKSLFDLGDGRGDRTVADIRAELDADRSMIETLKGCLI